MEEYRFYSFGEVLIELVFDAVVAAIGFYVIQNCDIPLWAQIFVGIVTFDFVLTAGKIVVALILTGLAIIGLWFGLDIPEERKDKLKNVNIIFDELEEEDKDDDDAL